MSDYSTPEANTFSEARREQFLLGLKNDQSGLFSDFENGEILRTAAVPEKIIIDQINTAPINQRLAKAAELGILDSPEGLSWSFWSRRPIVFTKVGGQKIPFYRSSEGTGTVKEEGKWYPFFGFGKDGWLIKGSDDNHTNLYNNPALKKIQAILDQTFDWDHNLDIQYQLPKEHPFYEAPGYCPPEKIDEVLFGQKELPIEPHTGTSAPWIKGIINKMYERYSKEFIDKVVTENLEKLKKL